MSVVPKNAEKMLTMLDEVTQSLFLCLKEHRHRMVMTRLVTHLSVRDIINLGAS
jgi:hypothetical protein